MKSILIFSVLMIAACGLSNEPRMPAFEQQQYCTVCREVNSCYRDAHSLCPVNGFVVREQSWHSTVHGEVLHVCFYCRTGM